MKLVTQQQFDEYNAATRKGGFGSAAVGMAGAGAASFAAQRFSPVYRNNLTLPLKVFGVVAVSSFAFVVGADRAGQAYEANRYDPGKESKELKLEQKLFGQEGQEEGGVITTSYGDRALQWVANNRYRTVAGAWAGSMVGSFAYVARQPLSFSQKLVQARMIAQGLTVGVLLVSAGLAAGGPKNVDPNQPLRTEDSIYKFKKDSPHEQKKHNGTA